MRGNESVSLLRPSINATRYAAECRQPKVCVDFWHRLPEVPTEAARRGKQVDDAETHRDRHCGTLADRNRKTWSGVSERGCGENMSQFVDVAACACMRPEQRLQFVDKNVGRLAAARKSRLNSCTIHYLWTQRNFSPDMSAESGTSKVPRSKDCILKGQSLMARCSIGQT